MFNGHVYKLFFDFPRHFLKVRLLSLLTCCIFYIKNKEKETKDVMCCDSVLIAVW